MTQQNGERSPDQTEPLRKQDVLGQCDTVRDSVVRFMQMRKDPRYREILGEDLTEDEVFKINATVMGSHLLLDQLIEVKLLD